MERKVKIVCTLGPASLNEKTLCAMMDKGMNVARLNFSHGTHQEHLKALNLVRRLAAQRGRTIGIMLDTKGPEIRTTLLEKDQPVELQQGSLFELRQDDGSLGNRSGVCVTHPTLAKECHVGEEIFIDDGTIQLQVEEIRGTTLVCRVLVGGLLSNRKGINIPDAELSLPAMSEKDRADILWGVEQGVDFVAISFVRDRNDVLAVRRVIEDAGGDIKLIAKIESRKAVKNLESIADAADGMMIARGDLGVEIPTEEVPLAQKQIIDLCRLRGKPTIVATQMLDSMIRNPRPTRAEANDVANAVLDGADAVMLSGESAAGKYPVLALETMARIVLKAQEGLEKWQRPFSVPTSRYNVADGISMAAVEIADKLDAKAIIALTSSGSTARMISKYRPRCPIIALTPSEKGLREMALSWGLLPLYHHRADTEDEAFQGALEASIAHGFVEEGDLVVLTAGLPLDVPGTTNMIRVHTVGKIVATGLPVLPGVITARACVLKKPEDLLELQQGDILVANQTDKLMVPHMGKASALVTAEGGLTSHAAILSLELGIPCIVGASGVVEALNTGMVITLDSGKGLVYRGTVNVGNRD